MNLDRFAILTVATLATCSSACTTVVECHHKPTTVPDSQPSTPGETRRIGFQLAEVRTQWRWEGTEPEPWGPFFESSNRDGFPGLHAPLSVVKLALHVSSFHYDIPTTDHPLEDAANLFRDRFEASAAAAELPFTLGQVVYTVGGPKWREPPPPPPPPGMETQLAFRVNLRDQPTQPYEKDYVAGVDTPRAGKASYWILVRVMRPQE